MYMYIHAQEHNIIHMYMYIHIVCVLLVFLEMLLKTVLAAPMKEPLLWR